MAYQKYMKYKTKYLALKNEQNRNISNNSLNGNFGGCFDHIYEGGNTNRERNGGCFDHIYEGGNTNRERNGGCFDHIYAGGNIERNGGCYNPYDTYQEGKS